MMSSWQGTVFNMQFLCSSCGGRIEVPRIQMGMNRCFSCASKQDQPKIKGRMVYAHKTGGEIELMSPESYNKNKKFFNRTGNRSILKQV
jgi:reverse gyrase